MEPLKGEEGQDEQGLCKGVYWLKYRCTTTLFRDLFLPWVNLDIMGDPFCKRGRASWITLSLFIFYDYLNQFIKLFSTKIYSQHWGCAIGIVCDSRDSILYPHSMSSNLDWKLFSNWIATLIVTWAWEKCLLRRWYCKNRMGWSPSKFIYRKQYICGFLKRSVLRREHRCFIDLFVIFTMVSPHDGWCLTSKTCYDYFYACCCAGVLCSILIFSFTHFLRFCVEISSFAMLHSNCGSSANAQY